MEGCSAKVGQVQDDQAQGQAPISSPTIQVTSQNSEDLQACSKLVDKIPIDSQVLPDFSCQSRGNSEDVPGPCCISSPSSPLVTFYLPEEFKYCMENLEDTSVSLENELFQATVRLEEQKAVFTGLKNLYVTQEMRIEKQEQEIGALEAQVEMQKRLVLNQIIHKKMIESMIADTDKFVSESKTFFTSGQNYVEENLEGLASFYEVDPSYLEKEEFQNDEEIIASVTEEPQPGISSALSLETNQALKTCGNKAEECAEKMVKQVKLGVSLRKLTARKLNGNKMESEPSSDDEWSDISSSDEQAVTEPEDTEKRQVSTECDPISEGMEKA